MLAELGVVAAVPPGVVLEPELFDAAAIAAASVDRMLLLFRLAKFKPPVFVADVPPFAFCA